jgi:hypothetical protein
MGFWLGIAALIVGAMILGTSYTVRNGRRHDMLTEGVKVGLLRSLYIIPLVIVLVLIGFWFGWLPS